MKNDKNYDHSDVSNVCVNSNILSLLWFNEKNHFSDEPSSST